LALSVATLGIAAGHSFAQLEPQTRFEDGSRVTWTAQPSPSGVWSAMRRAGLGHSDVGAWAVIGCVIAGNRRLRDCQVIQQSSEESQVGEALLEMAPRYRAASQGPNGASSVGRRVEIAMGYAGVAVP